ncbi:MAG TPA: hypothetical protein GXZ60_03020 [Intrasporangiaceae bacterium]|nr:hypothetical protein [Intrasporangiaceae bacterium]
MDIVMDGTLVTELDPGTAREVFDQACREELGISGQDFLKAYHDAALPKDWSAEAVCRLEMLLPLVT